MIETAIAVYGGEPPQPSLAAKGTPDGDKVEEFRRTVTRLYAGDWQRFFFDWYRQNVAAHRATQDRIEKSAQENVDNFKLVISTLEREKFSLKKELQLSETELMKLHTKLEEMDNDLSYINEREESREQ